MHRLFLVLLLLGATKEQRIVTKASVHLVKEPSFLAPPSSKQPVTRGEKITVELPATKGWLSAQHPTKGKGWIHLSYLSDRPVAFKITDAQTKGLSTVSGNYNLAFGGFTDETEKAFRSENPDVELGFARIEVHLKGAALVEPTSMPPLPWRGEELGRFFAEGGLVVPEPSR